MAKIDVIFNKESSIDGVIYKAGQTAYIPEEIGKVYLKNNRCKLYTGAAVNEAADVEPVKVVKKVTKKPTKK